MATHPLSDLLDRAAEAFERYEEVEVLQRLLSAWRERREPRVAALVERLSKRLTGHLAPLSSRDWNRVSMRRRPLDLPRLLPWPLELADRALWYVLDQPLNDLSVWPADPRLTPMLLDLARTRAVHENAFESLCKVFRASADPRALEPLRALRPDLPAGSRQAMWLEGTLQVLASYVPPPLDAESAARCEALEQALSAREATETDSSPTREALLARVYADPGDVSARLVLADHLLEQGVPLGELIALQCTKGSDTARVKRLLETFGWRWEAPLGPLGVPGFTRFERGFPIAVRLRRDWKDALPEPGPPWRTVRELDLAELTSPGLPRWLSHPSLAGVTTLRRVEPTLAAKLTGPGLAVRQLGLSGPVSPLAPELFMHLSRLEDLKRLFIRDASTEDVQLCAASGLAGRLERFEARSPARWSLVAEPARPVPLRATLLGEAGTEPLARVLRAAVGFGTRRLRVRVEGRASPEGLRLLRTAASGFQRVEWF